MKVHAVASEICRSASLIKHDETIIMNSKSSCADQAKIKPYISRRYRSLPGGSANDCADTRRTAALLNNLKMVYDEAM